MIRYTFPNGLENDDIFQWKGKISKRKLMAVMTIKPGSISDKSFTLEIHGFKKRVRFEYTFSKE